MPRQSDRDPKPRAETGKFRAARIPLDYYKHPDRLERWRNRLLVIGLVIPLAWWAAGWLRSDQGQHHYSRGPLAVVHATWEDRCDACHTAFTPLSHEAWLKSASATDQKCTTCHAGPIHHESQTGTPACATCHRDHRGRDASLVRMPDGDCTGCHGNLAAHLDTGKQKFRDRDHPYRSVTRFDHDDSHHPEFEMSRGAPPRDPGKLIFSHQRHLALGMKTPESDPQFTLEKIEDPAARPRYKDRVEPVSRLIKLDCADCHQLDSGDFRAAPHLLSEVPAAAVLPSRSPGAYMLPITYENQCAACHPLSFAKGADGKDVSVQHRLQPPEVHKYLEGFYANQLLKGNASLLKGPVVRLPGKDPETAKLGQEIEEKVKTAMQRLFTKNTCLECHRTKGGDKGLASLQIVPPNIPSVWFQHAVFNHSAHRAMRCADCHADVEKSKVATDVLIPDKVKCLECHSPPGSSGGAKGGARFDCVECHRYHNGDQGLQGIGAAQRGVDQGQRLEVPNFLSGERKPAP
jgi:hypothetical protein